MTTMLHQDAPVIGIEPIYMKLLLEVLNFGWLISPVISYLEVVF